MCSYMYESGDNNNYAEIELQAEEGKSQKLHFYTYYT